MTRVTLVLATSTLGLALTSGYLWKQLDAERHREQSERQQRTALQVRLAKLQQELRVAANTDTAPQPATHSVPVAQPASLATRAGGPADNTVSAQDLQELQRLQQQKRWQDARRKILDDPAGRELFLAQARSDARGANRDLARELQLTREEYDGLIELLARHELQQRELFDRSERRDTPFGLSDEIRAQNARLAQDISDLLGYDKAQQYAAFQDSGPERTQLQRLRGMLGERETLSDEQSAKLIAALQKERHAFNKEIEQRIPAERVNSSMGTWYGGQFRADRTSSIPAQEQFLKQIEEFSQRMRRSAADVLSAAQLRAFAQMQEQRLAYHRLETRTEVVAGQDD
jgi:hypothetical protein